MFDVFAPAWAGQYLVLCRTKSYIYIYMCFCFLTSQVVHINRDTQQFSSHLPLYHCIIMLFHNHHPGPQFTTRGWWSSSHGPLVGLRVRCGRWKTFWRWRGRGVLDTTCYSARLCWEFNHGIFMEFHWEFTCETLFHVKNSDGQISQVFRTEATQG